MAAKHRQQDPTGASTPEQFVELLRHVRADSGLSFWEIQGRAHDRGYDLEPAAVVQALGQPTLPSWQIVVGLLAACHYDSMQIDAWMRIYHELNAAQRQAEPAIEPPPPRRGPAAASRWTYRHGLLIAAAAAVVTLALLVVSRWDTTPVAGPASPSTAPASGTEAPSAKTSPAQQAVAATQPPPTTAPAPSAALRTATATLASGQGVDLDTGQASGDLDIVADSGTSLKAADHGKRLERMSGMPSQQACQSLSTARLDRDITGLAPGQWLCVHTSGGRWARLNITGTGEAITVSYLVWT
ncbi:hypothetical protein Rhe02_22260 [Rhizocola hellebori]|uniref:Uncharacterized protein n=1 Tax=Rhizocola hellebori TaxID=1392758 RepID=A0A8J3Q682_9ACTN|nr:hypothetical protein [Rhizocola hellebori]GIH04159.1 hypothetical protein Rhe02_22260 [Rhizocola hellebori]